MPTFSCLRPRARRMGPLLLVFLALGCGEESLRPDPQPNQADLYWDLELNHHAVVLSTTAPYDTLQLVATPRNAREEPLAGLPAAHYVSRDPERVIVTAGGTLLAVAPSAQPVSIVATLTAGNLKHVDSVLVNVVDNPTPPALASLSIHPLPPDSAKIGVASSGSVNVWDTLPARVATAGGELLPVYGLAGDGIVPVYFRSSDTTVGRFVPVTFSYSSFTGILMGMRRGVIHVYGSATVFGSRLADTLEYQVGWPIYAIATVKPTANGSATVEGSDVTINTGGMVGWIFPFGLATDADTVDITFADADLPNIAAFRPVMAHFTTLPPIGLILCVWNNGDCDNGGDLLLTKGHPAARYFPVPGIYTYHSVRAGVSGRVVVADN